MLSYCTATSYVVRSILDRFNREGITLTDEERKAFEKEHKDKVKSYIRNKKIIKEDKKDAESY
jgi:hypothetical protein